MTKKFFIVLISAVLIIIGSAFATIIDSIAFDYATLFTGVAALATAFAAFSAAKSSSIAEKSANTWKSQMALEIELKEAKSLKVAIHAWNRHFISESGSEMDRTFEQLFGHFQELYKKPEGYVIHLQQYLDELHRLWSKVETAFDEANFIENDFEARIRLRRLHLAHYKACKSFLVHAQNNGEYHPPLIETLLITTIYNFKDWDTCEMNNPHIYKVAIEQRNTDGRYEKVVKNDGKVVYTNPFVDVNSWMTQIGATVDGQIFNIRRKLKNI